MNLIRDLKKPFLSGLLVVVAYVFYLNVFGVKNTLIGLLFAVGSVFFLNDDFTGRLLDKFISFSVINLLLGLIAYIAATNIYIGLILNLIILFSITYIYMNDFKQPASFIFLMIYIYMYLMPVSLKKLPFRLISILLGVCLMMVIQLLVNRGDFNKVFHKSTKEIISDINNQIDEIINSHYVELNSININIKIRKLIVRIKEYTNNNFKNDEKNYNKFNIALCLYRLNMQISMVVELKGNEISSKKFLEDLKLQLRNISYLVQDKKSLEYIEKDFYVFKNTYENYRNIKVVNEIIYSLLILILSLKKSQKYDNEFKTIYTTINVPIINSVFYNLKKNFNPNSLKFKYAMRMSISMSLLIFVCKFFEYPNLQWLILSTYNVLQPYFEDSNERGRKRFIGVTLGAVLYYIIFYFMGFHNSSLLVMLITFTGYFYFKDYSKKVMMTTILSISVASIAFDNAKILPFDRFLFVVIGILIAIVVNKYLFPYKITDSIVELKGKYSAATQYVSDEFKKVLNGDGLLENVLYKSMERRKLECLLIENERQENRLEVETFIYHENLKMNTGAHNFLKYYYFKIKENN